SSSGLTLSGSMLTSVNGLHGGGLITGNLGSVSLSTGALISGALNGKNAPITVGTVTMIPPSVFSGGSLTITGNGSYGLNGVLFSGTFSGNVLWQLSTNPKNGTHTYTLTGSLVSANGSYGTTTQLTFNTGKKYFKGSVKLSSGDTNVVVPEPGTLSLMGTGLVGLAGAVRRKLKS
ncbi:MAG: PEP-CTERM sorting domain-containing protein, partial [Acidobacteriota bacterium]|nr:PEP-CTERM sorting domain-containing protein [Acidobacteriota bacterium]